MSDDEAAELLSWAVASTQAFNRAGKYDRDAEPRCIQAQRALDHVRSALAAMTARAEKAEREKADALCVADAILTSADADERAYQYAAERDAALARLDALSPVIAAAKVYREAHAALQTDGAAHVERYNAAVRGLLAAALADAGKEP